MPLTGGIEPKTHAQVKDVTSRTAMGLALESLTDPHTSAAWGNKTGFKHGPNTYPVLHRLRKIDLIYILDSPKDSQQSKGQIEAAPRATLAVENRFHIHNEVPKC